MEHKEVSLDNLITKNMAKAIDLLGYGFLRGQGYNVNFCMHRGKKGYIARELLSKQLLDKGVNLILNNSKKENNIYYYFTLEKENREIARSQAIQFVCPIIERVLNERTEV